MVGFQDSINLVKDALLDTDHAAASKERASRDHDDILRSFDSQMRKHEARMSSRRHALDSERRDRRRSRSPPSLRFRFKSGDKSERRRRRHRDYDEHDRDHRDYRRSRSHRSHTSSPRRNTGAEADEDRNTAHPLPRPRHSEFLDPAEFASASPQPNSASERAFEGPDDAFKESLFDAMADDEGAAYWEGVYQQPIHVYERPTVRTESGELEQMSDEQYAEYVKQKMWEKKNPDLVQEREERARRAKEEEAERAQRRGRGPRIVEDEEEEEYFEWVSDGQGGYTRFAGSRRKKPTSRRKEGGGGKSFMADVDEALARGARRKEAKRWQQAWASYQHKWQSLKEASEKLTSDTLASAIPWPVMAGTAEHVTKENIETFFVNATLGTGETRSGLLKAERVKWHPDKIQHRFGGDCVDAETLKLVTSVFQTIDDMLVQERQRSDTN